MDATNPREKRLVTLLEEIEKLVIIVEKYSPNYFINSRNELIIEPKNNIYCQLKDVQNELDLKCQVIAYLSRPAHKGVSYYWQKRILSIFNEFLGTSFSKVEMGLIYTRLGNNCNRKLCISFIEADYDLSLLNY